MRKFNRVRAGLLSATMLMGGAAPAFAQNQAPDQAGTTGSAVADQATPAGDSADGDIIVTGTRRAVSLQDVPINLAVTTAETLRDQRIDDVADLAAFTPGLTVIDTGPRSANNVTLRGITAADTGTLGANRNTAVGIYLGEVPLYLDFKLIDIARVETLLGPQGTLYGLGTLSGAIRYIPERPDLDDFSGEVHARYYDVSQSRSPGYQGDAVLNIPIVKDLIALRSVVGYYDDPGFIDYPLLVRELGVSLPQPDFTNPAAVSANLFKREDLNDEQTFTTRNALLLSLGAFRSTFTYAYQKTDTHGRQANGAGVLGTGRYEAPQRVIEPSSRTAQLFAAEVEIDIGDIAQIVSATAYTKQKLDSRSDVTDLLLDLDYDYELFPSFAGFTEANTDYKQFNQELRLVSTHGGPFSWVIGGFYNKFDIDTFSQEVFLNLPKFLGVFRPDGIEYISFTDSTTKEYAGFGEATLRLTDKFQVTGGLRYFSYEAEITGGTDTPLTGGGRRRTPFPLVQFDPSRVRSGSTKDDGFVYKINSSYEISPELFVYGTYSTGYRIGGVNRVAPCVQPLPAGQNVCALPNELFFGPDKITNKELGIRYSLLDRRLQGSIAAFHIDWSDVQIPSQTVNGAVGITANAAKARSQGIETTLALRLGGFRLAGNYAYTDARLTDDAPLLIDGEFDAFDGDRLPGTPKHAGALTGGYTFALANGHEIDGNWTTTYRGDIFSKTGLRGSGEAIPDYFLSRAALSYRTDQFEATLFANNIFDKYAVTSIGQDFSKIGVNDGVTLRYYNKGVITPRVVGLEFRVKL